MANKFKIGDEVVSSDGTACKVEGIKDHGNVYAVISKDGKRSFDAKEGQLLPVAKPKPKRQPRG